METNYAFTKDPGCGNVGGSTNCLDDYSQAAAGYAWIAAYRYRRGDATASVQIFRNAAVAEIGRFLNSARIRSNAPTGAPNVLCNGNVAGLQTGADENDQLQSRRPDAALRFRSDDQHRERRDRAEGVGSRVHVLGPIRRPWRRV